MLRALWTYSIAQALVTVTRHGKQLLLDIPLDKEMPVQAQKLHAIAQLSP